MTTTNGMTVKRTEWGYECSMSAGGRTRSVEIWRDEEVSVGYWGRYYVKTKSIRKSFSTLKSSKEFAESILTDLLHPKDC